MPTSAARRGGRGASRDPTGTQGGACISNAHVYRNLRRLLRTEFKRNTQKHSRVFFILLFFEHTAWHVSKHQLREGVRFRRRFTPLTGVGKHKTAEERGHESMLGAASHVTAVNVRRTYSRHCSRRRGTRPRPCVWVAKASGMSNFGGSREHPRAGEAVAGTQWHDR